MRQRPAERTTRRRATRRRPNSRSSRKMKPIGRVMSFIAVADRSKFVWSPINSRPPPCSTNRDDGLGFRLAVALRGDFDHEHVALGSALVVDLVFFQQPRHLVDTGPGSRRWRRSCSRVPTARRTTWCRRAWWSAPSGMALDDHHAAVLRGADRVPVDCRREQGDGQGDQDGRRKAEGGLRTGEGEAEGGSALSPLPLGEG